MTRFIFPKDGDMLNRNDGAENSETLIVTARISAPAGETLYINGDLCRYVNGAHEADVRMHGYRNTLTVVNADSHESETIICYRLTNAAGKYRLSVDDNIHCLKNLTKNAGSYTSVFDNPYFALYKQAHDLYGAKVHMNIYYCTDGFDLSQMTDKFKSEFIENSGWLRFAFHADKNDPARPYRNEPYERMLNDYDAVVTQIRRFAGQDISPVTTVHYCEASPEGVRALRARGIRCLTGLFWIRDKQPYASYALDVGQTLHMNNRNFWKDNKEDMIYGRVTHIINLEPLDEIIKILDAEKSDPQKGAFIELMIHEQYFYPDYVAYLPDYSKRVLSCVKWAHENGYEPAWVEDCVFER